MDTDNPCDCPACSVQQIFPPHDSGERIPSIVGIDVSTKFIALGIVPAMGELNDIGGFGFSIESKRDTERCAEAAEKTLMVVAALHESIDITSIAIEMPRGFGGKLIPIVGAITGVFGHGNVEWYAPASWQSIIKKHYKIDREDVAELGVKTAIHNHVAAAIPETEAFLAFGEDMRDALCIAMAHRIETLSSTTFTDYDLKWLGHEGDMV